VAREHGVDFGGSRRYEHASLLTQFRHTFSGYSCSHCVGEGTRNFDSQTKCCTWLRRMMNRSLAVSRLRKYIHALTATHPATPQSTTASFTWYRVVSCRYPGRTSTYHRSQGQARDRGPRHGNRSWVGDQPSRSCIKLSPSTHVWFLQGGTRLRFLHRSRSR
jgi:hypothetical protein